MCLMSTVPFVYLLTDGSQDYTVEPLPEPQNFN